MTYGELKKLLRKNNNRFHHEGSRHETWENTKTGELYPVGRHDTKEVPKGTLASILRKAGINK